MKKDNIAKAAARYRMWHQKNPDEIINMGDVKSGSVRFPDKVVPIGRITHILYSSDKWEKDGDYFPYSHDFDSKPPVYIDQDLAPTRSNPAKDVARLLKVPSLKHGEITLPFLAFVEEITLIDAAGEEHTISFREDMPELCCSVDRKTLVILSKDPMFIRGGKMVVTERGIVK